ncbi:MAG TPA: hypothetical protein VFA83_09900 [Acidimicrobiales bacterium]|nr:hypothetical protein [Acidimicrobiales bacterium]
MNLSSHKVSWSFRRRVVAAVVVLTSLSATAAFAYTRATGAANGSGTVGTMQTVTVAAFVGGDTPSSSLYPGGPAADVILRVNNPNSFTVHVTSIAGNGTITADAGHAGCSTTGVSYTAPSNPSITLPSGSTLVHLAGAASMSTASLSACQGATFNIPVTLAVQR